jgi:hypothetical protein
MKEKEKEKKAEKEKRQTTLEAQSSDNGAEVAWPSTGTREEAAQGGRECRRDQSCFDCDPKTA